MKLRTIAALGFVVACGSSQAKPKDPPAAQPEPAAVDCDEECTQYGVCYEEEYGGDYHGGGDCVSSCEAMTPADKTAWAARIDAAAAGNCHALFAE